MCAQPPHSTLSRKYLDLSHFDPKTLDQDQSRSLRFYLRESEIRDSKYSQTPIDRIGQWIHTLLRVEGFRERKGRLPRDNNRLPKTSIPQEERSLADWLRYQRRAATRDLHCTYQIERLQSIPGFSWDPRSDQWDEQFRRSAQFVLEHQRLPRYRSTDPAEKAAAGWLAKQRLFWHAGTLSTDRRVRLEQILSEWTNREM